MGNEIGKRIEECRRRAKLSQVDVAEAMGVSQAAVSKWEATGNINLARAKRLAELYSCSIDELAGLQSSSQALLTLARVVVASDSANWASGGEW